MLFLVLFHSSETGVDGRATAKSKRRMPRAAPQAAAGRAPGCPCTQSSEERHWCLHNWNTFRGQFFTGPPARLFPTITVLLPRTQPTDQQLPHSQSHPIPTRASPTVEHLHTQDTSNTTSINVTTNQCSPNLPPPAEYLPPVQPQDPSALGVS